MYARFAGLCGCSDRDSEFCLVEGEGILMALKLRHLEENDYYIISNVVSNVYLTHDEVRQLAELLKEGGF